MSWSKLLQRIEDAAGNLAVLTIRTQVTTTTDGKTTPVVDLSTKIDEVTGDIDNRFTESAYKLDYGQRVLDFHERQQADGKAILERNVTVIRQLLELVWDATKGRTEGAPGADGGTTPSGGTGSSGGNP